MRRDASALLLILLLGPANLHAEGTEFPQCVSEMADAIRAGTQDSSKPICAEELAPWQVTLHRHPAGWLTDGTALGLLHMPQRDDVPQEEWPLPVVLVPRSEHVWYIGSIHNGHILPELVGQRYFLWTPGNSQSGFGPDNVTWGHDAARMFRCLSYNGERCITYYPVRRCSLLDESGPDYVLVVRREDDLDVTKLLDTFGPVDEVARMLSEVAVTAICEGDE